MSSHNHLQRFDDSMNIISDAVSAVLKHPLPTDELDPRGYRLGYKSLVMLGSRTDWLDPHAILAMMYASYGWMPTVLKLRQDWEQSARELGQLVTSLRICARSKEEIFRILTHAGERGTLLSVNRSVVGTSKLLHFANPDLCPIWDKIIATRFGYSASGQSHNSPAAYLSYSRAIHAWLDGHPSEIGRLAALAGEDVGPLRRVEFALFLAARIEGQPLDGPEKD
ncbi:hypothetical protein [Prosthecodimorpha staleyi]|uniref:Uncharacterized protein n=1 Tax=Prosthecodimorpha staleyi TaxID=2840188 RepID=A0A947DAS0_9HYPH|nr:hypothetical protein [Prosthecodimorpha staleyi]MBT9291837.1 hypothetical protein [Prosthecodimorpha staleyi]